MNRYGKRCVLYPRVSTEMQVETVCLLSKLQSKEHIEIEVKMDELDLTSAESKATYDEDQSLCAGKARPEGVQPVYLPG